MIALAQDATQKNCSCSMKAMFLYPYSIALTTQEHCSYSTRTLFLQHKNIAPATQEHCSYNTRILFLQHKNIAPATRKDIQVFKRINLNYILKYYLDVLKAERQKSGK